MAASNTDLQVGFDPTGYTSISGAQLGQLVNSASPYSDKGLNIWTEDAAGVPDVPDASVTTKWQRYAWIRYSPLTQTATMYIWNPDRLFNITYTDGSTDFVQSYWNPVSIATIPPGSIFGYMIANGTITKEKIVSIDVSQIEGLDLSGLVSTVTTPTAGDISGSFSVGFTIGNNKVTTAKIADANVTIAKLDGSEGLANQVLYNIGAATVGWQYVYDLLAGQTAKATPVAADYIQIMDSAAGFLGKKVLLSNLSALLNTLTTSRFTSALTAITTHDIQILDAAHGLQVNGVDTAPGRLRAYLKCTSADQGYAVGDMINIESFTQEATQRPAFAVGANTTNVFAALRTATNDQIYVIKQDGSDVGTIDNTKWMFQVIAEI